VGGSTGVVEIKGSNTTGQPLEPRKLFGRFQNPSRLLLLLLLPLLHAGPYTLWDGNHRAVALFGYFDVLRDKAAAGAGGGAGDAVAAANALAAMSKHHHVRLYVGQSKTIWTGHKGSFYCKPGRPMV
jgi:hypothetical protein